MTYRDPQTRHYECGRGHFHTGTFDHPERFYCLQGKCGQSGPVFSGPEGDLRRLRAVFGVPSPDAARVAR